MVSQYEQHKILLENRYNMDLKEIISDVYITRDLGPSMGAKELDIPRQAFIYFRNFYGLRELKHAIQEKNKIY